MCLEKDFWETVRKTTPASPRVITAETQLQAGSSIPALKVDSLPARQAGSPVTGGCVMGPGACAQNPINRPGWSKVCFMSDAGGGGGSGRLCKGPVLP